MYELYFDLGGTWNGLSPKWETIDEALLYIYSHDPDGTTDWRISHCSGDLGLGMGPHEIRFQLAMLRGQARRLAKKEWEIVPWMTEGF